MWPRVVHDCIVVERLEEPMQEYGDDEIVIKGAEGDELEDSMAGLVF